MSFLDLAKKRYSVRKFKDTKVEPDKLKAILESAWVAPTAHNNQPQRIIVVQEQEGLDKLAKAAATFQAPLCILVCADSADTWKREFDGKVCPEIDASIVTDHMMLTATDLGLGSVWICNFDPAIVRREFGLPESWVPVNLLAIGYANREPKDSDRHSALRKPLEETVFYEAL